MVKLLQGVGARLMKDCNVECFDYDQKDQMRSECSRFSRPAVHFNERAETASNHEVVPLYRSSLLDHS